jgi:hypothetical protein
VKPGSTEVKVAGLLASGLDDNDDCGDLLGASNVVAEISHAYLTVDRDSNGGGCDNPTRDNSVLSPKPLHLVIKR